jgi:hypothetical protein
MRGWWGLSCGGRVALQPLARGSRLWTDGGWRDPGTGERFGQRAAQGEQPAQRPGEVREASGELLDCRLLPRLLAQEELLDHKDEDGVEAVPQTVVAAQVVLDERPFAGGPAAALILMQQNRQSAVTDVVGNVARWGRGDGRLGRRR